MIGNISFTLLSTFYILLLTFVYFFKPRVKSDETKIYGYILITCTVGVICSLFTYFFMINMDSYPFMNYVFSKAYLVFILVYMFFMTLYVLNISLFNTTFIKIPRKSIKFTISWLSIFLFIGLFIAIVLLPIEYNVSNKIVYSYGKSVDLTFTITRVFALLWMSLLILSYKRVTWKKAIPMIMYIVLGTAVSVVQRSNPELLLSTSLLVFVTFLMYFTIENPDVKMIEQLNIAKDQADKANKAKTDFLSNMSHEIRTPLNAIVGFSNLLKENKNVPEDAQDEIEDIIMASENLLDIVNGILDISKIEANKLEIVNSEYDTKRLLSELVALSKGRLGEKPIEFKTNFDESIPRVLYGDASRVKQVCVNILTNAIKYTKEGWIEFKVSSVIKDGVCRLIISVEDTGIGIKQENIGKLFNRFERLDMKENATIEGTGLGLAITKKLLDLMGGKIVVQSVFGKGSKFTISIDQKIVKKPTIKLDEIEAHEEKITVNDKLVLLVDDNKINLKVAEKILSTYGINTESVTSGFEAIDKVKSGTKYDLILLDDMMPKMSGVETLQKLKEIPDFNIKTIALTANALTGMKEKYLSDGFDDYLAKPINKDELNRIINEYLNNS